MISSAKFIPANRNTVVYSSEMSTLSNIEKQNGITRIYNNKLRLLAFEMNFLNTQVNVLPNKRPIVVYIGYCPGEQITKLVKLYEFIDFHLFDDMEPSAEITAFAAGNDIITLYDHYPTVDEIASFREQHNNVYLISNYTDNEVRLNANVTDQTAKQKHEMHLVKEQKNITDSEINMQYAKQFNAKCSLLKFRPPHVHQEDRVKVCDFSFFKGKILLPLFSGPKSSECRMIVANYDEIFKWDYRIVTFTINNWNFKIRESSALNPFTGMHNPLGNQLGNQFEICVFFSILRDYFMCIGNENPAEMDVYSLYSQFIIGKIDNADRC